MTCPKLLHFLCLLLSISLAKAQVSNQAQCYYPNGTIAEKDTPCRSYYGSSYGDSFCCSDGFACLENGICQVTPVALLRNPGFNSQVLFYRGSCTDQTWKSANCPQFCIGSQYSMGGGNAMFNCSDTSYCCLGGTCTCSSNNVTILSQGSVAFTTIAVTATTSLSSTLIPSSSNNPSVSAKSSTFSTNLIVGTSTSISPATTATAVVTASPSVAATGLSAGAKFGLGIGIPAGVAVFALIGILTWRTIHQGRQLELVRAQMALGSVSPAGYEKPELDETSLNQTRQPQDVNHRSAYHDNIGGFTRMSPNHRPYELQS